MSSHQFHLKDLDHFLIDLDMVKIYHHTTVEVCQLQKFEIQTQTDRQTDTNAHTALKYYLIRVHVRQFLSKETS